MLQVPIGFQNDLLVALNKYENLQTKHKKKEILSLRFRSQELMFKVLEQLNCLGQKKQAKQVSTKKLKLQKDSVTQGPTIGNKGLELLRNYIE